MLAVGRGLKLNSLAQSPHLAGTRLWQRFRGEPLGLIDVGSLGGVHPVAEPAASLIQALCFEPDEEAFRALPSKINIIRSFEWGTNVSPEKLNQGYTHCFFLTFLSDKDRDAYLIHPAHKEFGKLLGPYLDKALVVDFWAQQ